MAKTDEAHQAVAELITSAAKALTAHDSGSFVARSVAARNLAEAYAWLVQPNQAHGGTSDAA